MAQDVLPHNPKHPESHLDRRRFVAASSAWAALFGSGQVGHAQSQIHKTEKGEKQRAASDIGPENQALSTTNPNSFEPPPTDNGEVQPFWQSFSLSHRHIQPGGWSRQVNAKAFPMSKDFTGVNMRLTAGGIRELHWHAATEWAMMLRGNARLTAIDDEGRSYVNDVTEGDLWYFAEGLPHSIQGLGPDGCEFLLVFDDGLFSEDETTLVTDWLVHTPPEVLAKNWGLNADAVKPVSSLPERGRFIFQTPVPGPLERDRNAGANGLKPTPIAFDFKMMKMPPTKQTESGEVRIVDSSVFPVSTKIIAAHVIVKPGGMRELHWHQNSDEWQYFIAGQGRMTLFLNAAKARTIDFKAGDVGFVPRTMGHYIENTGDTDMVFLELFLADRYQDISLSEWVRHTPPELIMQHLDISKETLDAIPKDKGVVVPA